MTSSTTQKDDAASIRGILALILKKPATIHEIEQALNISGETANRLMALLQQAGIAEHPTVTRIISGAAQKVPQAEWKLTRAAQNGEVKINAKTLTGGRA